LIGRESATSHYFDELSLGNAAYRLSRGHANSLNSTTMYTKRKIAATRKGVEL
jgi:hypothetical protein